MGDRNRGVCEAMSDTLQSRLSAVDGLRGVAVLLVVYQHAYATAVSKWLMDATGLKFPYLVANGWMGVGLFFVLSGFVLALPYFTGARKMAELEDIKSFYAHRAKRLFPLFLFMAFVSYGFALAAGHSYPLSLFLSLTTTSMFTASEFFPTINGPFWSLFVEIWFCALFPFLMMAVLKHGVWRVGVVVLLIALVIRGFGAHVSFIDIHINPVKDFILARMDDFFVGMTIAWLYAKGRIAGGGWRWVVVGLCSLLASALLWDIRLQGRLPLLVVPFLNTLAQVGFGSLLVAAISERSSVPRALSVFPLRVMGIMCFSLYLWHGILLRPAFYADLWTLGKQIEFWGLLFVLAAFTFRYIEFPRAPSLRTLFKVAKPCVTAGGPKAEVASGST